MHRVRITLVGLAAALAPLVMPGHAAGAALGEQDGIDACVMGTKLAGFAKDRSGEHRTDDAVHAVALAMAESGCRHLAAHQNPPANPDTDFATWDLGAWQINDRWHPEVYDHDEGVVTDENWQDMAWSAREAYALANEHGGRGGRGWSAWSTWRAGTYKQFLKQAREAVYRNWSRADL
ncbi:hypothetical protein FHS39_000994 [Streptomyces olivoverticillatus]|uniref:Transglycosylase SLT domain-containing protein n=1 Tax=Streptomyces olivoverticillatus TaxID=66427 RepID=A0A7W7PJC4_9ACTN|nr:hypothetical protein [Streptomyces olivoverticillatus]